MYSPSIDKLIAVLKRLPSVGQHTAERFVFYWLKSGKKEVMETVNSLEELLSNVKSCETCWNFSDTNPCPICQDKTRDKSVICVVSDPQAVPVLEGTGEFQGTYHILRGTIDATDPDQISTLKISELLVRLKSAEIKEIILALNPDMAGETTMMYLEKEIKGEFPDIKTTRLARGLPTGSDIQYADEITLGNALKHRHQ
jgi:recombination protein RecR